MKINRYEDTLWFHKESWEDLVWWLSLIAFVKVSMRDSPDTLEDLEKILDIAVKCLAAEEVSSFRIEKLLMALS